MFHEIAMFLYFMTYILGLVNEESTKEIIQYTDSDFLKMVPNETRLELLINWFERYVINPTEL